MRYKIIDLTGQKFGNLLVISKHGKDKHSHPTWDCLCDCGKTAIVNSCCLRGNTTSCGCNRKKWLKRIRTEETKKQISVALTGRIFSEEHRKHLSEAQKGKYIGELSPSWKGGKTYKNWGLRIAIRGSAKYSYWRKSVFERDGFTCQFCGTLRGEIQAHHKKRFKAIVVLNNISSVEDAYLCDDLWDLDNGITLCSKCHKIWHKYKLN